MVPYCTATAWEVCLFLLRADNCVKNHFYSKLRKALRKINRFGLEIEKG